MLIYIIAVIVIVISFVLYKFFGVLETLVIESDDNTNKKEDFANYVDAKVYDRRVNIDNVEPRVDDAGYQFKSIDTPEARRKVPVVKILTSPATVSIPSNKNNPIVFTGGDSTHKDPLDKTNKYTFPIPKLLYDGIWDRDVVNLNQKGYQENNWQMTKSPVLEGTYGTNHFINVPQYDFVAGQKFEQLSCDEGPEPNMLCIF